MRSELVFAADTVKQFAANPRRGSDYKATIHNLTDQTITITVTNMNIQEASPVFDAPASGALTVTAGAVGLLNEAYQGWNVACSSATGSVHITEAG